MPKTIFLNLPVKGLAAATRFYEAIGCKKNEQLSACTRSALSSRSGGIDSRPNAE